MKSLFIHPMFLLGLAVRLFMIAILSPYAVSDWYSPFIEVTTNQIIFDPWATWLDAGGSMDAFPYGYAMWLVFLPFTLAGKLFGLPGLFGYKMTLLVVDIMLLLILCLLLPSRRRLVLATYWLSPVITLASYGLGYNDLVPVTLLILSIYFIRHVQLHHSGAVCAAAISAKLSMVVALPFFLVYLYNNRALRVRMLSFFLGFAVGIVLLVMPFFFSESGLAMLFSNPEMGKVYRLALDLGGNVLVYVVPLVYLIMLYMAWRVRRLNFELFLATTSLAFLLIVLLTPTSPGWFIWCIPFLVFYQATGGRTSIIMTSVFSGLYILSTLLMMPLQFFNGYVFDLSDVLQLGGEWGGHAASLLHTAMVATGMVLALRIWREAVSHNDYFRLSRKPFVIGIAGDSGAGKDVFSDAIGGLFGGHSIVKLSGDDYHLWDRQKPMWQVMTHLNPMANDLERFSNDLVALIDGKRIQSRHYSHETGKMSSQFYVNSNDFIIASGLHALYLPILRECYNLKIYLDMDEELRRYFKLKRDVEQRNHSVERVMQSFSNRESDSARFIRSQSIYADLVFSLQPIHPHMLKEIDDQHQLRLKLMIRTRHSFNELALTRILIGVCGLHVDMVVKDKGPEVLMAIEGETSPEDIAMAASLLCPRIIEFMDIQPQWEGGVTGLMQLVTLTHINQALTKRIIR